MILCEIFIFLGSVGQFSRLMEPGAAILPHQELFWTVDCIATHVGVGMCESHPHLPHMYFPHDKLFSNSNANESILV